MTKKAKPAKKRTAKKPAKAAKAVKAAKKPAKKRAKPRSTPRRLPLDPSALAPLAADMQPPAPPPVDPTALEEEDTLPLNPPAEAAGISGDLQNEITDRQTDAPPATPPRHEHFDIKHDLKKRVDLYLRDRLPDISRAAIQKLIKAGDVLVNSAPAKPSTVLRAGDTVDVTLPASIPDEFLPENIPLDIVYEDDSFLAVNKQSGLIVHPARGHWTGTLINALVHHAQQTHSTLSTGSDPWRPGIIHRLDRDTTGLILIAKTDEAHWRIAGQFERRTIRKTYLALVHGEVELHSDLIDAPLGVHPKFREKYAVRTDSTGKPAQTVYTIRERFRGYTLLELAPKTGRTHQIRVHCMHIHHPIVGDTTYGGQPISLRDIGVKPPTKIQGSKIREIPATPVDLEAPLIERQALHAFQLQFVHPTNFQRLNLEAKPPADIENILTLLRKYRPYVESKETPNTSKRTQKPAAPNSRRGSNPEFA